jgi:hypothetical protein
MFSKKDKEFQIAGKSPLKKYNENTVLISSQQGCQSSTQERLEGL